MYTGADSLLQATDGPSAIPTSTTAPASYTTTGPVDSATGQSPGQTDRGHMRSSIACVRCRRSKVKCVNNGVGTTCRSCENSGRDCQYPPPVAAGSRRRHSQSGEKPDGLGEGERRQRPRKSTHTFVSNPGSGSTSSPRPHLDALDARLLTPLVWQELFEIFQIHYSADLPFLHPPTFLKPLRAAPLQLSTAAPNGPSASPQPPASQEFLLAFLALTARFHPKLVAHHSPATSARPSNPLIASEYYAAAAAERLSGFWTDNQLHDIERTQALLMLGLHEWGMCRGAKAWLTIGQAIRCAQAMGLQYEMDLDDEPLARSRALNPELDRIGGGSRHNSSAGIKSESDAFIQQEIRRRTFWSCYIMDRYLSSGKYRPQMLHARELRIQLPASERSFMFAEKVRTLMLGEEEHNVAGRAEVRQRQASVMMGMNDTPEPKNPPSPKSVAMVDAAEEKVRLEIGEHEGLVSRYIKVLELYGKIVKWSCLGGRRTEEYPPWDQRCEFYKLRKQCMDFKAGLPRQHTLTPQNTQAHITMKSSTPYTLIHTVYLLCQIMLHREYVPFIPIRCTKPEGPLDPPLFPRDKYDVPPGLWEESAKECFKSARDIMDLVRSCQEWSALVETPIVGFAMYNVAFVGVYCINFPQMDPEGYMCTPKSVENGQAANDSKVGESKGFEAARKALEMIGTMRPKMHMADGWFKTITRMHRYFKRMKRDYKKSTAANESGTSESDMSPISGRHLSLREGGIGGGLDEFKLLERTLKEFGTLEDQQDMELIDARPSTGIPENVYDDSNSGTTVKSEDGEHRQAQHDPPRSENGQWNAVNAGPSVPASQNGSMPTPNSGSFRPWNSFSTQQPQQSQPPPPPPSQPQGYPHPIQNFRPDYSQDGNSVAGAPPSLTSPGSHSTSPSHASPPFERQHQSYTGWTAHNTPYSLPPQSHPPYGNNMQHPNQQPTPVQTGPYPTPAAHPYPSMPPPGHMQEQHQPWTALDRDAFLKSIEAPIAGDDIAAFVDGGEMSDWARGYGGGWLSAVWGTQTHGI